MPRILSMFMTFVVLFGCTLVSHGGEDPLAIVDKAIKAHGIKGKDDKQPDFKGKNKGTLHIAGMDLEFTQEITLQVPEKFKEVMEMTAMGNKLLVRTVFNGKEGWIRVNTMDIPVNEDMINEFKEVAYMMSLSQKLFLKDKSLKLALIGESQVKGKPAIGVRVSKEGHKELSFYFDKESGLMTKLERRARDAMGGQEVTEERIITAYQDIGGRKIAKKVEILRDGNPFLEAEVIEAQFLEKLPDSEFTKPE